MPKRPQDFLADLQQQFGHLVPDVARVARDDLEQHAKVAVMTVISRLDLVTRDEFDAQTAVLQRTREKVDQLEKQVAALEARQQAE